jgi:hypothetical protein
MPICDYIQDGAVYKEKLNAFARGEWEEIDVELMSGRKIYLTKHEWKELQRFLRKHQFDKNIPPESYQKMPTKSRIVINDWMRFMNKKKEL